MANLFLWLHILSGLVAATLAGLLWRRRGARGASAVAGKADHPRQPRAGGCQEGREHLGHVSIPARRDGSGARGVHHGHAGATGGVARLIVAVGLVIIFANLIRSVFKGQKAPANPWGGRTLEWTVASPPPHENFEQLPVVERGPYPYDEEAVR